MQKSNVKIENEFDENNFKSIMEKTLWLRPRMIRNSLQNNEERVLLENVDKRKSKNQSRA